MAARTEPAGARSRATIGVTSATRFLTILPVGVGEDDLGRACAWFPIVGAGIGALAGGVRLACEPLVGRGVASALAMVSLVLVTGGLHQDGLADSADGLGARGDRTRRLAVMRDPATGAFGALALIGWALLLVSALDGLNAQRTLLALVTACAAGRWACLLHAVGTPPARADGLGARLTVSPFALSAATVLSIAIALAACGLAGGAVALGAAALTAGITSAGSRRTLGGRTGDTLGATVAIAEVAVCIGLLAIWRG